MRRILATAVLAASLAGCAGYHQEVAALRAPRPTHEPAALAAYAAADPSYPSVGGDTVRSAPRER